MLYKEHILAAPPCLLTAFVALPLLDLECQVKGADGEVDSLGVHSSHLADKRGSQITFQRLSLRTAGEREGGDRASEDGTARYFASVRERVREIILIQPQTCCNRGSV